MPTSRTGTRASARRPPAPPAPPALIVGVGLLVAGVLALGGCSGSSRDGDGRRDAAASPSPSATSGLSSSPQPSGTEPAASPTAGGPPGGGGTGSPPGQERITPRQPGGDFKARTVQGAVRVEGLCTILVSGFDRWVLLGSGVSGLRSGEQVQVVGTPSPNEENACDGGVFHVQSINR